MGLGQVTSNGDAKEQKEGTSLEIMQNSISYYEAVCRRENQMIKQTLLANLAYVELELENPVRALYAARALLELPDCSRMYIFLGICSKGSVHAGGSVAFKNSSPEDSQDMFPKPEEALGTLYANIAAIVAVQGEFDRAHHFVTQALFVLPKNTEATLTAIYADLMVGKSQGALAKLKQCSHVRFLPGGFQSSKSC